MRAWLGKVGDSLRLWARALKSDVLLVYFAARDPRVPLAVRALALAVAAYALSPIDLIPDFIPVLGYLDDLLLVPLGLYVVIRLLPAEVLESARLQAARVMERPRSKAAALVIVCVWIALAVLAGAAVMATYPATRDAGARHIESVSAGYTVSDGHARLIGAPPQVAAHGPVHDRFRLTNGRAHEFGSAGRMLLKTLNLYVPAAYTDQGRELPAFRG